MDVKTKLRLQFAFNPLVYVEPTVETPRTASSAMKYERISHPQSYGRDGSINGDWDWYLEPVSGIKILPTPFSETEPTQLWPRWKGTKAL